MVNILADQKRNLITEVARRYAIGLQSIFKICYVGAR